MKTRYYVAILAVIALLCGVLSFVLLRSDSGATHARVYSGGELVGTVDLRVDQTFTVTTREGETNVIAVEDGKIAVTEASCPDQYCVRRGYCSGGAQIVCLPNGLVISFVESADVDFAVG